MALASLTLSDFRNHALSELTGARRFNLLLGDNGAGKTNVLEAISLLSPGRGMRRAAAGEMAREGGPGGFAIGADLRAGEEIVRLGTKVTPERPGRRTARINGADAPLGRLGEWLGMLWLTPAMDRLFTDSPGGRRRFLDRLVLALEPGHARHSTRYEAALRERNRLLSDDRPPDPDWLAGLEAQLAEHGAAISAARARLVERLANTLAVLPDEPFARPDLALEGGGPPDAAELAAAFGQRRREERAAGRTLVGPHRADLVASMAGKERPARDCSTGEQKAMLIALVLAHAGLMPAERPLVLLLDEVAAHLDPERRAALFERLRNGNAQVWLTGTEAAPFEDILDEAARWDVAEGAVTRR
ncbi:DNA replication/repair protein RecF [Pseudoblastomonas halimionae]|uniref:DNA replication and repair protein RecF n=1 Tax=Alteriqipengyuania halimionae TaxID=1926630 RepID=A0A6I4U234_9SPHN|nr:DNA replication/repair protein RecF [Alteriqipengyuania halimionae]MXP10080.1 DNA replication/repair protein RecF [Alteriqipengyuania halimionae]